MLVLPVFATIIIFFWAGERRFVIAAVTVFLTACFAGIDAHFLGLGTGVDDKGKKEASPFAWFLSLMLFWVFTYPQYFYIRAKKAAKGSKNLWFISLIAVIAFVGVMFLPGVGKVSTEELSQQVAEMVKDKSPYVKAASVTLVHKGGNDYEGLIYTGEGLQIPIQVIYDGKTIMYRLQHQ